MKLSSNLTCVFLPWFVSVGEWLYTKKRSDWVIATKARWPTGRGPNDQGLSRSHLMAALEASLERLKTTYVDLYYIHAWDGGTPLKETLVTLNDMVRAGKVRYIGIANFSGWQLQAAIDLCERLHLEPISCIQQQYSLLCRETEWEIIPCARNSGLAVLPWSPLKGGWLSGRYQPNSPPPNEGRYVFSFISHFSPVSHPSNLTSMPSTLVPNRVAWSEALHWPPTNFSDYANDHTWNIIKTLESIAKEIHRTPSQVALRWLLQKPCVPSVLIGARTIDQFHDNLQIITFELSEAHMNLLDSVSAIQAPYPYDLDMLYGASRYRK